MSPQRVAKGFGYKSGPSGFTPGLQHAADLAEKHGDTQTQDVVKKLQYPEATDFWGKGTGTETAVYPSEARQQRYRTQARAPGRKKKY